MLTLLRELTDHKGYANASLLKAIRQHDAAASDLALRTLLHHILIANRFWLLTCLSEPFLREEESRIPDSLDPLIAMYRATHDREAGWLADIDESELRRVLENPFVPGGRCSVSDALDSGLVALTGSSLAVRDDAAPAWWDSTDDGFHPLGEEAAPA